MLYGPAVWDPFLITAQIVAVQCIFYIGAGVLMAMLVSPYAPRLALFHIFDWHQASFKSFQGWMVAITFFLNALGSAAAIRLIVQRAKKCLDFSATVYFIHFLAVAVFSGSIPRSFVWWLCTIVNLSATALLSEWLCLQQELKEIPLTSIPRRRGNETELIGIKTER